MTLESFDPPLRAVEQAQLVLAFLIRSRALHLALAIVNALERLFDGGGHGAPAQAGFACCQPPSTQKRQGEFAVRTTLQCLQISARVEARFGRKPMIMTVVSSQDWYS